MMLRRLGEVARMPPSERRAAVRRKRYHLISTVTLGWLGSRLNRANRFAYLSYVPDAIRENGRIPDFQTIVAGWTEDNGLRNAGDIPRMLFLLQNAERVVLEGVPGDFAELGVHKGHSAKLLADSLAKIVPTRQIYLFDTFDGFDERDLEGIDADVAPLFSDTHLAAVQAFVGNEANCVYRPGYFPDSASGVDPGTRFALVHLDCDLYQPMQAALAFFYPRMSSGGVGVLHDYGSGHWPGVPRAVDEFLEDKPEKLILMPDKSGTAVFRKS